MGLNVSSLRRTVDHLIGYYEVQTVSSIVDWMFVVRILCHRWRNVVSDAALHPQLSVPSSASRHTLGPNKCDT